jgi:hypothetical protein
VRVEGVRHPAEVRAGALLDHGAHQCLADAEPAGPTTSSSPRNRTSPWDARLCRYSHLVAAAAFLWTAIGLIAGLAVANATLLDTLLSFFVPSLAAYQIAYEIWSSQGGRRTRTTRQDRQHRTEQRTPRPAGRSVPWSVIKKARIHSGLARDARAAIGE